ncbi:DnaE-like DNA polymerase III [Microbacterium phage Rie18]|nr:DnaE-like DNA polymerase III [Microbacterium phage Rie18]
MKYVSLHSHSTYSYMDGFGLPEAHVERVAELGMTALALTEHGNVSSHVKLEQSAKKHGIKPIFGLEAYTAPMTMREDGNMRKWHMTMLATDLVGLNNLYAMVTTSWERDFYRWPTVLGDSFRDHNKGIIALSGCADSHLACTLLGGKGIEHGDYDAAVKVMLGYKRLLGDRYYLECQRFPGLERSRILNQQYALWSAEYGIPLAASSDVHYPRPEENEMQKILHAAGRNTGTVAAAEAGWEYDILLTYPESDKQIRDDLIATGLTKKEAEAAILNTAEIADRCNVELPKMDRIRYPGTTDDLKPWPRKSKTPSTTSAADTARPADTSAPAVARRRRTRRASASSR